MSRFHTLALTLAMIAAVPNGFAATNVVLQGDNLQTKIDAASPGDVMVVQAGAYSGYITVSKPLSFVKSGTEPLQMMNPFSVQSTGTVSLSQFQFLEDFTGTSPDLRIYDCQFNKALGFNDGKLTLKRVNNAGALTMNRAALDALRLTNYGQITINGVATNKSKVVMVQSQCRGLLQCDQVLLWLGYFSAQGLNIYNTEVVAVGCDFYNAAAHMGTPGNWVTGNILETSPFRFVNCRFLYSCDWAYHHQSQTALWMHSSSGEILNCDIMMRGGGWPGAHGGDSYGIVQSAGKSTIKNCLFRLASHAGERYAIVDYSATMDLSDSLVYGEYWYNSSEGVDVHAQLVAGEARNIPVRTTVITNLPLSLELPDQYTFKTTIPTNSPIFNAGSVEPIYRNVDGTRNTVGSTGGPFYHPENATTDRPIAFWLMTTPRKILKGVDTTIKMEAAAAAGH